MPMRLDEGWNQIQFNLSDFTRRAYGTNYIETHRVQVGLLCMPSALVVWDVSDKYSDLCADSCQLPYSESVLF